MKRSLVTTAFALCAALCLSSFDAAAQSEESTGSSMPAESSSPPPSHASSSLSSSGARGPIGIGGVGYLGGLTGLSLAYDPGAVWHLDTVLGLSGGNGQTNFGLGARFWYHLHSASSADLSAGGGLSYLYAGAQGNGPSQKQLDIEIGALIRVFLAERVALGAAAGMVFRTLDADGYAIGPADLVGSASLHYFF